MSRLIHDIRDRLSDINLVSFSGGKDSTVVLQHVISALDGDNSKRLYIVTADTLMEIPFFQAYVDRTKEKINNCLSLAGMNASVVTVKPEIKNSFWVSVLGKGYPAAHMGFRWCTGVLKIDPISIFTKAITKGHTFTTFVGVRSAESELRARIYTTKDYRPHHYAPILDWSAHDVWEFLLTTPAPWGDHSELLTVYKYSSDECVYGEKQGVCVGNARYGCWACPLQSTSQLEMIGYHTGEQERYTELKRFKQLLVGAANKTGYRSRIRRNGEVGAGPFLVGIRKMLFSELKATEQRTGWKLITTAEQELIARHWAIDEAIHNIPDPTQPVLWRNWIPSGRELVEVSRD